MRIASRYLLPLLALVPVFAGAETAYVSDQIEVMVRRGQATSFAILDRVRGGQSVEVLKRENGYAQIRTPRGIEGWVVGRYLTAEQPARSQLSELQARLAELEAERDALAARLVAAEAAAQAQPETGATVAAAGDEPPADAAPAAAETATGALTQLPDLTPLQRQMTELQAGLEALEPAVDAGAARRDFMLLGAGILVAGVLVGLLLPHLGQRGGGDW